MLQLSAAEVRQHLPMPALIEALAQAFVQGCTVPQRHHHTLAQPQGVANTLLLMPAWTERFVGVKLVMVCPNNGAHDLPAIQAQYLLSDARSGEVLALLDGGELTALRTVAASALAARYLAAPQARTLLVLGTGRLAQQLPAAHRCVRPIERVLIWGRDASKAQSLAKHLQPQGLHAEAVTDLETACAQADIISCATLSPLPLLQGTWLRPGCHVDAVGAYTPQRREVDSAAVLRSKVFVDSRAGALHEGGDLAIPMAEGVFQPDAVHADLTQLCRGEHPGRQHPHDITLFKSVGLALEDLAAAVMAYDGARLQQQR